MTKKVFGTITLSTDDREIFSDSDEEGIIFELDMDIKDAIVEPIDGVLIKDVDDDIRLLFYYHKPGGMDIDEETIECKGVAEFRTSKQVFKEIVKHVNQRYKTLTFQQKTLDEHIQEQQLPMFI
jgi:hypothetical protein